jgi:hypothetical protein
MIVNTGPGKPTTGISTYSESSCSVDGDNISNAEWSNWFDESSAVELTVFALDIIVRFDDDVMLMTSSNEMKKSVVSDVALVIFVDLTGTLCDSLCDSSASAV